MALGINTNVASINAQNQLSSSQSKNDQALERLSSGLRINSAKDDAAGLAISTRFEAQINGLNQANRNANDGISLSQTAEGGLDEITNNLQRVRELGVQAANATNSDSDRQALNDEAQQRLEEIDRIAGTTAFNGLNVLDGSLGGQDFQVGANVGETIEVDLEEGARTSQLGQLAEAELDFENDLSSAGDFTLSVGDGEEKTFTVGDGADDLGSAAAVAEAVEAEDLEGVTKVDATNQQQLGFSEGNSSDFDTAGTYKLTINNETVLDLDSEDGDSAPALEDVKSAINDVSSETGVTAEIGGASDDELILTSEDGENIAIKQEGTGEGENIGIEDDSDTIIDTSSGGDPENFVGQVSVQATEEVTAADEGDVIQGIDTNGETFSVDSGSLDDVNVKDVDAANDAITRIDQALDSVNSIRSELGAVQNRFESTIANLDNNTENLEASNSRIKDADFASESAKLSQSQVLQQAGISVLSQANQRPQQVLSLLQ